MKATKEGEDEEEEEKELGDNIDKIIEKEEENKNEGGNYALRRSQTKIEKVYEDFMSEYWDKYDVNKDGKLDKSEFKTFITDIYMDVLSQQNGGIAVDKTMLQTKIDSEFEQIFNDFDSDRNGFITKDEMYYFVLELLGVEVQKNVDF